MKNSPAFQFYPETFLADLNVKDMTLSERGAYITLLCHCWMENGLPFDSRVVQRWFKQYPTVAKCFYKKDGFYRNNRLDIELNKQALWREKSRRGGLHSAESKRVVKGGSRVVQPKVNTLVSSSISIIKPPNPPFCKGGRKHQRKIAGSNNDPAYREAYEKNKAKEGKA